MVSGLELDDGLAVVREIVTGLRAVCGDAVPLEAVANWTNRERAAVVAWLRQIAAAGGDRVADPPRWLVSMRLVHGALSPDKAAAAAWAAMREHGAGDAVLHSQVAAILSSRFVTGFADGWGECCWRIDSRRRAAVWFGAIVPPERRPADLAGAGLLRIVRRVFGVPKPRVTP